MTHCFFLNGSYLYAPGTSVAFFGVTPPVFPGSQNLTVSIDGNTPYNTSYGDPNPQSYRQWYQSPLLSDGSHNIELSHIAGTSLDFAVVTVGQDTPLSGQKVIVDNDDPGLTFNGSWRRSQDPFNSGPQPDGFPYHNTTHHTTDVGSSFTYHFTGTPTYLPQPLCNSKWYRIFSCYLRNIYLVESRIDITNIHSRRTISTPKLSCRSRYSTICVGTWPTTKLSFLLLRLSTIWRPHTRRQCHRLCQPDIRVRLPHLHAVILYLGKHAQPDTRLDWSKQRVAIQ